MSKVDSGVGSSVGESVDAFLEKIDLVDVRVVKFSGELASEETAKPDAISFDVQAGYRFTEAELLCRFDSQVLVKDEHQHDVARIELGHLVVFAANIADEPSRDVMDRFMADYGFFVAVPYVREAVQAMSVRLGIGPINFGFFRRGSETPVGVYIRQQLAVADDSATSDQDSNR